MVMVLWAPRCSTDVHGYTGEIVVFEEELWSGLQQAGELGLSKVVLQVLILGEVVPLHGSKIVSLLRMLKLPSKLWLSHT
ncbi:hypothetical protein GQ457_01G049830 [Hibiscus cannabinus]